jgi:hypothetical protein
MKWLKFLLVSLDPLLEAHAYRHPVVGSPSVFGIFHGGGELR